VKSMVLCDMGRYNFNICTELHKVAGGLSSWRMVNIGILQYRDCLTSWRKLALQISLKSK
jgi:hypothetical protein